MQAPKHRLAPLGESATAAPSDEKLQKLRPPTARFGTAYAFSAQKVNDHLSGCQSFYNKEIAEYFKIGEDTVIPHLSNIYDKVGVSTRVELVLFAVNHNLPLEDVGSAERNAQAIGQSRRIE